MHLKEWPYALMKCIVGIDEALPTHRHQAVDACIVSQMNVFVYVGKEKMNASLNSKKSCLSMNVNLDSILFVSNAN